ncbi:glycoside hydrolase family 2 TIM barrel-domain containing protein [Arthrobacter sp. Alg241-R88]|uniref:glycoside hydrolase family 2 TIM barrel-domain containing protein n=1 Tax=Arthrobacter sp. Alg241-R88 TaxID=2305984 RepID=UPI0013D56DA6|nr:glycoside hydrolase family 2 TIM barrel-domain containing protein [Arthrobacter sp. Alg241-R88]
MGFNENKGSVRTTSRRTVLTGLATSAALAALAAPAAASTWTKRPPQATRQREREQLNEGWRFFRGDIASASKNSFDDTGWTDVTIPHTWNAQDANDDEAGYYRGPGWYRSSLKMKKQYEGKRLFLYFEGANQVADVYVEGAHVGNHVGGYQAFSVEITDQVANVKNGRDATIAVRVDNSHNLDIPPLSADFTFYGGIYRNVWLVVTEPVHLDLLDHASSGVYVETPLVTAAAATVLVRSRVVNDLDTEAAITVQNIVLDDSGKTVVEGKSKVTLAPGETREIEQTLPTISRPQLWSPESPYLYTVATIVDGGSRTADRVDSPLGLRWFSVNAATGFYLNGERYPLRGANRHQDQVGKGNALTDEEHVRDLQLIKAMGANVVRLAHYPQAPAVLEAADELGLVLWEEAPLVNEITRTEAFTQNSINMQIEMIRQHYNHPSIIFWGYMNEILIRVPRPTPEGYIQSVVDLAQSLEDVTRAEDRYRLTVMACNRDTADRYNTSGLTAIPMIVAWNLYYNWYYGNLEGFAEHLDRERANYPDRPLWVSEYGADTDSRLHRVDVEQLPVNPESGRVSYQDQSIEFGELFHETYVQAINDRPWLVGTTLWAQFEFGAEQRTGSIPHVNQKGIMHPDRTPKDVYFFYQAQWLDTPVLRIASHEWQHRAGTAWDATPGAGAQPVRQPVKVYTNLNAVELFLNGASLGVQNVDEDRTAVWDVPFVDGRNDVVAVGRDAGGRRVEDKVAVTFTYNAPQLSDPSVPFERLALSAGAIVQYTDPNQLVWIEDREYTDGAWGAVGGKTGLAGKWTNGSSEDPLYQTYREGMSAYRFDVPNGRYEVRLRFADPQKTSPGERVFTVKLGNSVLKEKLDLVAVAGASTAYDLVGTTEVADGQGLIVTFDALTGLPVVSGIDVRKL